LFVGLALLSTALLPALTAVSAAQSESQLAPVQGQVQAKLPAKSGIAFPFREHDRVAWIGSSSTNIGVWPKTMQFLLRTRHANLDLKFQRFTTGSGTFHTALQNLDKWLGEFKPTVVVFNYGGNDAGRGEAALDRFKQEIEGAMAQVQGTGARAILMTHQPSDLHNKAVKAEAARLRTIYAETMISLAQEKGWPLVDTYHPLNSMQDNARRDDPTFTINKDPIHLNDPAYVAWGMFLYEGMNPPPAESVAEITASGQVSATSRCRISNVQAEAGSLSFSRADEVLPILPPAPLPPRRHVPLEELSRYMLKVTGLSPGQYEITCEGKPLGTINADTLEAGVNLNSVLLDAGLSAPWADLAAEIWDGKSLDQIGQTQWRFEIKKRNH
jgi:lysophospholipase L1-like esterase